MTYGETNNCHQGKYQNNLERMKLMVTNKADGVCEDFANYEVTLFSQLGIKAEYLADDWHAWSVVYPTNLDEKKLRYVFDYELEFDNNVKYRNPAFDNTCDSESDIY